MSHLLVRHVIQIVPAAVTAGLVARGGRAARYAALPVFITWLLLMVVIWLFLLGLTNVINGHFTIAEILLTVVIGGSCVWGLFAVLRCRAPLLPALAYFLFFAVLQCLFLWVSFLPAVANR